MKIALVILTFNEARHLRRCIESTRGIAKHIYVIDSHSSDDTCRIAREMGATVLQRDFTNHADQFNWGLAQLPMEIDWVIRLDADEVMTPELVNEVSAVLPSLPSRIHGVSCHRRMIFMGKMIRHGGVFPVKMLRIFRLGHGQSQQRLMDEHIVIEGAKVQLRHSIVDHNLNSLTWWTEKHNQYASREAMEVLNRQHHYLPRTPPGGQERWSGHRDTQWKHRIYRKMPAGLRAFAYFCYRYVIRLGFLDGWQGLAFHFLQGCWYRYLVDLKVQEIKSYASHHGCSMAEAAEQVTGLRIAKLTGRSPA